MTLPSVVVGGSGVAWVDDEGADGVVDGPFFDSDIHLRAISSCCDIIFLVCSGWLVGMCWLVFLLLVVFTDVWSEEVEEEGDW